MRRRDKRHLRFIPIYSVLATLGGLMLAAFVFVVDKLADRNIHFYINIRGITIGKLLVVAVFGACFLFVTGFIVFLHRNLHFGLIRGLLSLGAMAIACYFAFSMLFAALFFMPRSYVCINSNDGQHSLVVGEDSRLLSPYGGDVYERTTRITMRKLGEYEAGVDLYKPFSARKYQVEWGKESVTIQYDYDGTGNDYRTITFEYIK